MKTKDVTIAILFLLFLGAFIFGCFGRKQRDAQSEVIRELNTENFQLRKDIASRDSLIIDRRGYLIILEDSLELAVADLARLKAEYKYLEEEYADLEDQVKNIPTDESYLFLTQKAYPDDGELKYPFSDRQVSGMHLTYIQKDQQGIMIGNLKSQLDVCAEEYGLHKMLVYELKGTISAMQDNRIDLEKIIDNKDTEITIREKENRRERRNKRIWQVAAIASAAAAIIL